MHWRSSCVLTPHWCEEDVLKPRPQHQQCSCSRALLNLRALLQVVVDSASVAVYACRSLERLLCCRNIAFASAPTDNAAPLAEDHQRVLNIVAEADDDDYWFAASRDGNREAHYRGTVCNAGARLSCLEKPITSLSPFESTQALHASFWSQTWVVQCRIRARARAPLGQIRRPTVTTHAAARRSASRRHADAPASGLLRRLSLVAARGAGGGLPRACRERAALDVRLVRGPVPARHPAGAGELTAHSVWSDSRPSSTSARDRPPG